MASKDQKQSKADKGGQANQGGGATSIADRCNALFLVIEKIVKDIRTNAVFKDSA